MFNYKVDAAILQPRLPLYTEIDFNYDKAIGSGVGFLFNNTRVMGLNGRAL